MAGKDETGQWLLETTIFVVEPRGERSDRIARWLRGGGAVDVRCLTEVGQLPRALRAHQREADGPALALISHSRADEAFTAACQRLHGLTRDGLLGLVALFDAHDGGSGQRALAAGCLDAWSFPTAADAERGAERLALAVGLIRERHLRLSRERRFEAQLAERRVMEARLNYLATHDELTDLGNRRALEEALNGAIAQAYGGQVSSALLYLDLDRFKLHNDSAGHGCGDYLLRTVANVLRRELAPQHLLTRLGSDEFAVLLRGLEESDALAIADRLKQAVRALEPDGDRILYHVGVSIGLTIIRPGETSGASQALAEAEQACYVAKTRGGDDVHLFSAGDQPLQHLHEDMDWALPIRRALAEKRLFLVFQPILSVRVGEISHFEALVRMPTALGGDGQSAAFMRPAERLGLAQQIDMWVVNNAIDFLQQHAGLSLGVNLSTHALQESDLLPMIRQRLDSREVAPDRLTFEITETAAVMNFAKTRRMVDQLRELGCRFALDDFGSGFSSYNYLKRFPVDTLKIDGSFVLGVRRDKRDRAIVQSMVDIAHGLEKDVVAEFIEDGHTLRLLTDMGIDHAQGYYIGRPTADPLAVMQSRGRWGIH